MSTEELLESSATSMSDDEIRAFLTDRGVGTLVLPDDEVPYAVPMSFGYDGDAALYFVYLLFGPESHKETLSDRAERARFLSYRAESMHDWRSVTLVGRIDPVADDEWDDLQRAMENAWHPNLFSSASPMRGVEGYRFEIEEWKGLQHGD